VSLARLAARNSLPCAQLCARGDAERRRYVDGKSRSVRSVASCHKDGISPRRKMLLMMGPTSVGRRKPAMSAFDPKRTVSGRSAPPLRLFQLESTVRTNQINGIAKLPEGD
jgi:hypothetical protein